MKTAIDTKEKFFELIDALTISEHDSALLKAGFDELIEQFRPRPYSLDPNSKEYEYKVPEVGEKIDLYEVDKEKLTIIEWLDVDMVDAEAGYYKGYLWLPSRTKDDFGR